MANLRNVNGSLWSGASPGPKRKADAWWPGSAPGGPLSSNYEGSTFGRRTMGWIPGNDSVNAALFGSGEVLRARSRDQVRKNAWAGSASETFASEVVGTGIKPKPRHSDPKIKEQLQKQWLQWTDYADAYGTQDFYGLQALALRSVVEGGECFVRLRFRKLGDGFKIPLQVQILEAEHCPTWKNESFNNGNTVKQGIEFNQFNQRVAYWLYPIHPGERGLFGVYDQLQPVRIPASQILHLFRPIRPGQIRGEPWLSRALVRLYDIDQWTDAQLMRQKVAAMFAGFITELDASDPLPGNVTSYLPGPGNSSLNPPPANPPAGVAFAGMEPGTLQKLNPGEDIKFSAPADVGSGYEPFLRSSLREVAASVGISYEQLTGDLTGVNYSSIRAGLLKVRRFHEQLQHGLVVFQFCRPIWQAVIESAVFAELIKAKDYNKNQDEYLRVDWIPDGWAAVDPVKDLIANKGNVRAGFTSSSHVISSLGQDIEEVYSEIDAGNAKADELRLIFDSDARQTSDSGMRPAAKDPGNPDGLQDPRQPVPSGVISTPSSTPAGTPPAKKPTKP